MTATADGASTGAETAIGAWFTTGALTLAVVLMVSLGSWYVLADPRWSPLHMYPFPINAVLFWAILMVVFLGFNLEFWGFERLTQPTKGLALVAVAVGLAIACTALLAVGVGHFDPRFAGGRKGGTGYFAGALFVLFGFFSFVTVVVNWGHWPWASMRQPKKGLTEIGLVLMATLVLYAVLGLPTMALTPGRTVLALNTLIGWFYSVIVSMLITGLLTENWPWRLAGPGWRTALASVVGNLAVGTVLYFSLLGLAKTLIGARTVGQLGPGINIFPAQIGVCWAFWMILWSNAFANCPTTRSPGTNYAMRVAVTLSAGVITFVAYYRWIARTLLHEPAVAGSLYGNALGFIDWAVLWMLFYVVFLESYGLQPGSDAAQTTG
jgi:amino acid transporter, AAT family